MIFLRLLVALLVIGSVGMLALQCIFPRKERLRILEWLGLAFGLGTGLVAMGMFYLAYWGIHLNTRNVVGLALALGFLLTLLSYALGRGPATSYLKTEVRQSSKALRPFDVWLGLIICLPGIMLLLNTVSKPLQAFDARAIWGMKAQILFHQEGIYGEDFFDRERLHAHQRYPLLIPLAECFVYHLIGRADDRYARVLFPGFFISMNLTAYATLRRFFGRRYALTGTALLMGLPAFSIFENGGASSGYADVPLAYFCVAFVSSLFLWLCEEEPARFTLATLFGLFLIFTKQEGLALWVLVLASVIAVGLRSGPKPVVRLKFLCLLCLITVVSLYSWFHYRSQLPSIDEEYFSRFDVQALFMGATRLPFIVRSFLKEILLKPHLWSFLGVLVVVTLCFSPLRTLRLKHSLLFWVPSAYCALICLVFVLSPWKVEELVPISLTRLLIHVAPLLILWLTFQIEAIELLPKSWTRLD